MYLDLKGLVTTGAGNLIDNSQAGEMYTAWAPALKLPWRVKGEKGRLASQSEIATEWQRVKDAQAERKSLSYWPQTAKLVLADADLNNLVMDELDLTYSELERRPEFATVGTWPADAELGLISMGWAMGAGFHFPLFQAAAAKRDFAKMAAECHMDDEYNPGLVPRNRANFVLFMNASVIDRSKAIDPDILVYPTALPI